jgi:hypothetical protein
MTTRTWRGLANLLTRCQIVILEEHERNRDLAFRVTANPEDRFTDELLLDIARNCVHQNLGAAMGPAALPTHAREGS